jgi:hypothetical protein
MRKACGYPRATVTPWGTISNHMTVLLSFREMSPLKITALIPPGLKLLQLLSPPHWT